MFGRFNRFNTTGSNGNGYESASRCASFNFILLVIDAVLAVSIFVILGILLSRSLVLAVLVSVFLVAGIIILRSLILPASAIDRPSLAAA